MALNQIILEQAVAELHSKLDEKMAALSQSIQELEQGLNSDLPGEIKALVAVNVYDTGTGKFLLIPKDRA